MATAAPKQHLFVSNRDLVVGSTSGHSIRFERGVPTHVPRVMHREVLEKGIVPCDVGGKTLDVEKIEEPNPAPKVLIAPEDAGEREDAIRAAVEQIAKRNASADFTAGGVPSSVAVSAALGWKVDPKEIRPLWTEFKKARAEAGK